MTRLTTTLRYSSSSIVEPPTGPNNRNTSEAPARSSGPKAWSPEPGARSLVVIGHLPRPQPLAFLWQHAHQFADARRRGADAELVHVALEVRRFGVRGNARAVGPGGVEEDQHAVSAERHILHQAAALGLDPVGGDARRLYVVVHAVQLRAPGLAVTGPGEIHEARD